ncbi:hypothetical protein ACFQ14_10440 [Pseudahrensia aquimaris]|uniref:Uncharacterized protein n=1 Tax=Pseudahrensia aquimaris TaxID=744461 RepID=A0ABW3FJ86_9HYPH
MTRTNTNSTTRQDFRGSDLTAMDFNQKVSHGMRQARIERAQAVRDMFSGLFGAKVR